MKLNAKRLAQAVVEEASKRNASELPALIDALAEVLRHHGKLRLMRLMPGYIERAFNELHSIVPVTVTTPSADNAKDHKHLKESLEKALGKTVELHEKTDPALIGGARIALGDERIDFSLQTELQSALSHLSSSVH